MQCWKGKLPVHCRLVLACWTVLLLGTARKTMNVCCRGGGSGCGHCTDAVLEGKQPEWSSLTGAALRRDASAGKHPARPLLKAPCTGRPFGGTEEPECWGQVHKWHYGQP